MVSVRLAPVASAAVSLVATLLLAGCAQDAESKVAEAAAKVARETRTLGPDDLQMVSLDRTVAIEVVGDSVHVFMANSTISVPVTYVENVKYADGRLRFDIKGFGMKMFEVGDGREGAVFTQVDALQFVAVVISRQNKMEAAGK
jgi:ABC-type Fe3+-hydroxamate transport system substrate-binding protein